MEANIRTTLVRSIIVLRLQVYAGVSWMQRDDFKLKVSLLLTGWTQSLWLFVTQTQDWVPDLGVYLGSGPLAIWWRKKNTFWPEMKVSGWPVCTNARDWRVQKQPFKIKLLAIYILTWVTPADLYQHGFVESYLFRLSFNIMQVYPMWCDFLYYLEKPSLSSTWSSTNNTKETQSHYLSS